MALGLSRLAPSMAPLRLAHGVLALWAATAMTLAAAQTAAASPSLPDPRPGDGRAERTVSEWLARMHDASRQRSYVGTFVVSSSNGGMASARIWHACDGQRRVVERIENLSGERRSTFRRDNEVLTFLPQTKTVRSERQEFLGGGFTELLKTDEIAIPDFYTAHRVGSDRVAGFEADIVQVLPKDALRFGYRIWSEKRSGLVVKLQTIDDAGHVLEQAAFSELQLDAPVRMASLLQMMAVPEGWHVEKAHAMKTTAAAEGWGLKTAVAGFRPMDCYKRPDEGVLQWIFSDGLASVSLFIEDYDRERHVQEGVFASGATHTLTRRVQDWWVTVVGEVPPQTLKAFALGLERRR